MHLREQVTQPADPSYRLIALTRGQVAKVDAEDYERLNRWPWFAHWDPHTKSFRAARGCPTRIYMHREVMNARPDDPSVDHSNHDTLDNRRLNLRFATDEQSVQNQRKRVTNKSGFKGVCFHKATGRWASEISLPDGGRKWLGVFDTPEEAHEAWKSAATENYGEFACHA